VGVVACVGVDDVVDGVGDRGDFGAPGSDGVDPVAAEMLRRRLT
jgi:hypothetical protein